MVCEKCKRSQVESISRLRVSFLLHLQFSSECTNQLSASSSRVRIDPNPSPLEYRPWMELRFIGCQRSWNRRLPWMEPRFSGCGRSWNRRYPLAREEMVQSGLVLHLILFPAGEAKLGKLVTQDKWKSGARNTNERGGRIGQNKLIGNKTRYGSVELGNRVDRRRTCEDGCTQYSDGMKIYRDEDFANLPEEDSEIGTSADSNVSCSESHFFSTEFAAHLL